MTDEISRLQYQKIVETCQKSQEILDTQTRAIGVKEALSRGEPHENIWKKYSQEFKTPACIENADFRGLLFNRARFTNYRFLNCDFSRSRWVFAFIENSDCSGSKFSGINTIMPPFLGANCSGCDFSGAEINHFDFLDKNIFQNADFTNAKLTTSHSFFKNKKPQRKTKFKDARMNGCRLLIKKETMPEHNVDIKHIQELLGQLFSPEQLAVMHIEYEGESDGKGGKTGCFIATVVCGIDSEEVRILRRFRDNVLADSAAGRLLVRIYYRISPAIASVIASSPKARYIVRRAFIQPCAKLADKLC